MKKSTILKVVMILALAAFFLSFLQIYRLNEKYPAPAISTYVEKEPIHGGDITITVMNSRLEPVKEITKEMKDYHDEVANGQGKQLTDRQKKILIVELKIENTSQNPQKVDVTQFMAQSGAWANGWDLDLYLALNNTDQVNVGLEPLTSKTVYLGYSLYDFQFKAKEWGHMTAKEFYLVMTVYPYKNRVLLTI